jgi:hypothetical protein
MGLFDTHPGRVKYAGVANGSLVKREEMPEGGLPESYEQVSGYGPGSTMGPLAFRNEKEAVFMTAEKFDQNGGFIGGKEIVRAFLVINYVQNAADVPYPLRKGAFSDDLERAIYQVGDRIPMELFIADKSKIADAKPYFSRLVVVGKQAEFKVEVEYADGTKGLHPMHLDGRFGQTQNGFLGFVTANCTLEAIDHKYNAPTHNPIAGAGM